jgi:ferredoxin
MTMRLRVDPIACSGHGLCGELLPEMIRLDDWGYPILDETPIDPEMLPLVRRTLNACPALALRLVREGTAAR